MGDCFSRKAAPSAEPGLGHVGLAHHGGRPSVRAVGRGDILAVQGLGDLSKGLAFREQRPDLRPPSVVPVVAPGVGQSNVLGDELPAGRLKDRVVVARGRPLVARRPDRIELAAPLVVVALRHLALQGEELTALGHLHKDILHAELAELVRDRFIRHALILTQEPPARVRDGF